jgi:hypothetical protein
MVFLATISSGLVTDQQRNRLEIVQQVVGQRVSGAVEDVGAG